MVIRLAGLIFVLILSGCQGTPQTFAGFTFGGGGNTFNCEPAIWRADEKGFQLTSGDGGPTSISLSGSTTLLPGEMAELSQALVRVPSQGEQTAQLVSGNLVLQSQNGAIVHGSFDLQVKLADGREFPVVGSFTAEHRLP